jgi:phosphomannomutase
MNQEEYILSWTKPPFSAEIQQDAERVLEEFKKGEKNADIEGYTVPLEFGTGGIRGIIGNGLGRMNVYTVGRVALGFFSYLKTKSKKPLVVISYDPRRMSTEFAEVSAGIAASLGIKVKLFSKVAPTPILSYAVRHYKAVGGIMITASHNPAEYNGFKAYLADGGQLVAPDDAKIIETVNAITDWNEVKLIKKTSSVYKEYVSKVEPEVFETYIDKVINKSGIYNSKVDPSLRKKLKVVYSPLHGTGGNYMKGLFKAAGYTNFVFVKEEEKPNGEFPTVKYPNPEEREALELTIKTSTDVNANIFIATDPDADRLGVGIRKPNGSYELLNGNQMGSIMCAYLAERVSAKKQKHNYHVFKTIVTTDLQEAIAKKNGITIHDVLTGFKFIAMGMAELDKSKEDKFLFGGEESYGYLPVDFVRDKDSLSSALLFMEILLEKKDILQYLNEIYLKYGLFMESLKSITMKGLDGQEKISESMDKLRNMDIIGQTIGGREVISLLDYKKQTTKGKAKKTIFKGMPPANVIQLELANKAKVTIRPSGTEPKVKIYCSFCSLTAPKSVEEIDHLKTVLVTELKNAELEFSKMVGLV